MATSGDSSGKKDTEAGASDATAKKRRVRFWLVAASASGLATTALVVILVAYVYGERLASVRVTFTGKGAEAADANIPLLRKAERLPDYKLHIICATKGFWIFNKTRFECGPIPNRSAKQPIDFTVGGDAPRDRVQQINLLDDDPLADDLVASVQVSEHRHEANGYLFELKTERSLRLGLERIWKGNFGFAVIATLLVLVLTLIAGAVESLFELAASVLAAPFKK